MRKFSNIISLAACFVLLWGCDEYDDGELRQNIDAIEQELTETEKRVERLNEEMNSLSALINSSFISYLKQDDEGNYVISYRDHGGETKTVTLATQDDVVTAPIVGAGEFTDGNLYWRTTADNGKTYQWLLDKEGKMMPVGGVPPAMDIDAEGFWIVDGQRLTDKEGNPILANDVSNTLFQKVETDEESGMVRFTLADGSTFEIPVFEALSIRFDAAPVTAVPDRSIPVEIEYTVAGSEAETAYVDYFTAWNVTVKIDKYTRTISVKLDENAEEGNVVVIASAGGNTVLKPLFFTYGTAQIDPPTWDPQFGTGAEVALEGEFTEFDIRVSANIDYEVTIAEECQSWLKPAPKTRAETVTTTHSFVADYYENDSGADRKGSITFSNRPYGITVTLGVRQSPVVPDTPTEPGIATGADLVAFAKAVNAGGSTDRWENASGEVVLLNDIDLTELTEWTPIGQGKATGSPSYNTLTNPFTGVFDGQGFTIKGIRWTFNVENETTHLHGLFGAIKDATIKNLKLGAAGDQITLAGTSQNVVSAGALAGYAEGSTIVNVTNNVSVILTGDNPDATLMMLAGIAGCIKSTTIGGETKDDAVINNGDVKTGRITNTANGGTGMNIGGICAFTLGAGTKLNYCTNNGEISAPTGRGGGLVGTLGGSTTEENGTVIANSTNNGTIQDDAIGQYGGSKDYYNYKRMGGLVGGTVTNNNLRIEYCTNNGNVFSQLGCRTGGFVGHNQATSDRIEIRTAEELVQFAENVNAGTGAQRMTAVLMNDIDMTKIASWIPIGNGSFVATASESKVEGAAFEGTFDGQGHALLNCKMTGALTSDNQVYGLFGILKGATVRNLVLGAESGDTGSFTVSGNGTTSTGVIAGACVDSKIEKCTSYLPMICEGNNSANKLMTMGLVGFVYGAGTSEDTVSQLTDLTNYGALKADPGAANANGFTSTQVGGIAGFSNTSRTSTFANRFLRCINHGDMTVSTGRASGIVAAANTFTHIVECENYGDMMNTYAGSKGGRLGNITCILGTQSIINGCTNHGDVVTTNSQSHAGGLLCLSNATDCEIINSANYGNVISDLTTYRGTLVANINSLGKMDNNIAGGGIGSYNGGDYEMVAINEMNFMDYIGKIKAGNEERVTNTKYGGEVSTAKGIRTADDLVALAAAVNSGKPLGEWQNENGEICLLTDIDMSEVAEWTPIGKATFVIANNKLTVSGTPFAGHFNGQGYRIRNLKMVAANSEEGATYGLFGTLAPGAVIENFSFDTGCSFTVASTAGSSNGVVAGLVYDATVRDITSSAPMLFQGAAGNVRITMALIGTAFAETANVTIDNVNNNGTITAENRDNNTNGGATGYHIAGIAGFTTNDGASQQKVIISDCINYGDITSATGRTAGIVAAANRYTQLANCVNHGKQLNTCPKNDAGRLGNIACNMGAGSSMIGCSNYGDLTSTTGSRCGGITSAAGDATFENCANYGTILTDSPYRGVFWGYNNAVAQWTDCTAGGKVGTYNANAPVFDSYADAEQANYLGKQGANQSTLTNIAYQIGNSGGGSAGGNAELRILFIGNSFTKDAVEHLPGILKAMGIDKVKMTHMYYGGRTVPEYNNGFATVNDYRCYECNPGAAGWTESMNKTIKEVAASEQWDVVTIQEHTGKVNAWKWTSAEKEALQGLIDNVKSTQTGAMPKFYYILSQAYADPALVSYSQQTVIVNNFASSQTDMYAAIVAQGQKVMSEVAFDDVIATGTVLQNLRTSKLQNAMDMTRDGYHMDYGISRYAASCAVFEKLISPAFGGVTLDGNPFRYTTSNTTHGSYSTPVTEANAPIALQAARYALTTPYAVTDMSHIGQESPDNGIEDTEFEEDQNKE